jgi:hypothetical protein
VNDDPTIAKLDKALREGTLKPFPIKRRMFEWRRPRQGFVEIPLTQIKDARFDLIERAQAGDSR